MSSLLKRNVLIIEDNPADLLILKKLLTQEGYQDSDFTHADTLEKGLQVLSNSNEIQVLLLDLNLPSSQGIKTLHQVKERAPMIPVVVVTSITNWQLGVQAIQEGAQDFFCKEELQGKLLKKVIDHSIQRQEIQNRLSKSEEELQKVNEALQKANESLQKLSVTDPLTGVYNRRGFEIDFLKQSRRFFIENKKMSALLIDCDDFKNINDCYGHAVGDLALQEIARILQESLRPFDLIGRIGGDEFLIFLPNTSENSAKIIAERLQFQVATQNFFVGKQRIHLSISIGLSALQKGLHTIADLLRLTRKSLQMSKTLGKEISKDGTYGVNYSIPSPKHNS